MKRVNTFGVHFVLRKNKPQDGKFPVYARIPVNSERCGMALKSILNRLSEMGFSEKLSRFKKLTDLTEKSKIKNQHLTSFPGFFIHQKAQFITIDIFFGHDLL